MKIGLTEYQKRARAFPVASPLPLSRSSALKEVVLRPSVEPGQAREFSVELVTAKTSAVTLLYAGFISIVENYG